MTEFSCPKCGALFSIDPDRPAAVVACPQCSMPVEVPTTVAYSPPVSTRGRGMAVTALVLGVLGLIPVCGVLTALAAMILGIVVLATGRPGKGFAIAGLVVGALALLMVPVMMISILLPALGKARELARQAVCMANLRATHQAVAMYALDYRTGPPDLDALVREGLIDYRHIDCPSEGTPGSTDYFYFAPAGVRVARRSSGYGRGAAGPSGLMICDLRVNHVGRSRTCVLDDGLVQHVDEADFQAMLRRPENVAFAAALRAVEGP